MTIIPKRKNIRTLRGTTSDWETFDVVNKDAIAKMIQDECVANRKKEKAAIDAKAEEARRNNMSLRARIQSLFTGGQNA